jgi:glycine cleavage system aminomethyltransferase T
MALLKTPLYDTHVALGAKMVDFAGYEMPVLYTGIQEEHLAVRKAVGVFDVSHMGEFIVRGKEALDLVQKVTSNDASKLEIGQAQYSCLPNASGGIVDDLLVYRLQAVEQLRAPLYEDKVVDFILQLARVADHVVTPEELMKDPDDEAEAAEAAASDVASTPKEQA